MERPRAAKEASPVEDRTVSLPKMLVVSLSLGGSASTRGTGYSSLGDRSRLHVPVPAVGTSGTIEVRALAAQDLGFVPRRDHDSTA